MDEMRMENMEKEEGCYTKANYWREIDQLMPRLRMTTARSWRLDFKLVQPKLTPTRLNSLVQESILHETATILGWRISRLFQYIILTMY